MNVTEIFIKRPVMTSLVTAAIVLFGSLAYISLPVSDLPNLDLPTITVSAGLPGATAETMAAAVATPLEQALSSVPGIDEMSSKNARGQTQITLQFDLDVPIDTAALDVQSALSSVLRRLPPDMPSPPTFRKVNPADDPIMFISVNSPTLALSQVDEYAETIVLPRLSTVKGVALIAIGGGQKHAVRAQLDPKILASRGIGLDEIRTALGAGNANLPTGNITGGRNTDFNVKANGQLSSAAGYRALTVAYRNGSPIRLGDLGRVIDGEQDDKSRGWFNGVPSVLLQIQRQPGTNVIDVVSRLKAVMPEIRQLVPASVDINVFVDRSTAIRASVSDVRFTLILAIALVVVVIFIFLRKFSATLIPSLAMPIAVVGTFAAMYFFNLSVDNLSLLALTLSVGFVVDDAIVMLENIVRHTEMGKPVMEAALIGSREIGFTILSMTLSLVAVFLPVLFMNGLLGRLLHEFAITISAAIIVSGFVSLSLTPMLCSRFLKPAGAKAHGWFHNLIERGFDRTLRFYEYTLRFSLRHRVSVALSALAMAALSVWLVIIIPKGFIPTEDRGRFRCNVDLSEGASFDSSLRHLQAVLAVIANNPYVESNNSNIGTGAGVAVTPGNEARFNVQLIDWRKRPPADQIMQSLRPKFAAIPGVKVTMQLPPSIQIGGHLSSAGYQLSLYSADLTALYGAVPEFADKMRKLRGVQDTVSELRIATPEVVVDIDRDQASALGITAQQIEDTLFNAFGERQVSTIYTASNQYRLILELEPRYQRDPAALSLLYVRSPISGKLVPLQSIAHLKIGVGPLTIDHLNQLPSVLISFNLRPGYSLSQVTDEINRLAHAELPATVSYTFQGSAAAFAASLKGLGLLLVVAIAVIYIILGVLYEDFAHPFTILSGLPAATFGALLTLKVFHQELNMYGYVGIIMLIGIVKKNAIMMVDFALEERKRGASTEACIYDACLVRYRPILMTSLAALAGTLPIALGWGAGASTWRSLGIAVVGGLLVSQPITLYITPVFYIGMEKLFGRFEPTSRSQAPAS